MLTTAIFDPEDETDEAAPEEAAEEATSDEE